MLQYAVAYLITFNENMLCMGGESNQEASTMMTNRAYHSGQDVERPS